jgi:general secretion pathway protein K
VVLLIVLFFALLLTSSIATFTRRATVDAMISRNRESAARAEALARGGVRLGTALILDDAITGAGGVALDSHQEPWARLAETPIETADGDALRLRIEDAGTRLNLNSLIHFDDGGVLDPKTEPFLRDVLEKVIEDLPPEERLYDLRELSENLIDYMDDDDVRRGGGGEDDYYQRQTPPYRAANGPLMSLDELRLVEGFDGRLVDALRPYVTVHPYVGGGGINPNTAPPHVLALLFIFDGVDLRLAPEDMVRDILEVRADGDVLCPEDGGGEECVQMNTINPGDPWVLSWRVR